MDQQFSDLSRNIFQGGATGVNIYYATVEVPLVANQSDYQFGNLLNRLERHHIVGIMVNFPEDNGFRSDQGSPIVTTDVAKNTYLNLRSSNKVILEKFPIRYIYFANQQGFAFRINTDKVNITESTLYVANPGSITTGHVVQLTFAYVKVKG